MTGHASMTHAIRETLATLATFAATGAFMSGVAFWYLLVA
jgi:hypothetical protein